MSETRGRYSRVMGLLLGQPWAMLPEALELFLEVVERRLEGREPSPAEKAEAVAAAREIGAARRLPAQAAAAGVVAVVPVHGPISSRLHMVQDMSSGGTSAEGIALALRQALAAPNVSAIVLDVDSPGGSVFGIQELADEIAAARGSKPIVAVANGLAASAAYWIAAAADEVVVSPSSQVGSVGVYAAHDDVSKAAEQKGVRRTFVHAGKYKVEGNPFEPLSDEARSELQRTVDRYHAAFVKSLARGRGVSQAAVRERFGEGRMFGAVEAVERGMADRVGTLEETIGRLHARAQAQAGAGGGPRRAAAAGGRVLASAELLDDPGAAELLERRRVAAGAERVELLPPPDPRFVAAVDELERAAVVAMVEREFRADAPAETVAAELEALGPAIGAEPAAADPSPAPAVDELAIARARLALSGARK